MNSASLLLCIKHFVKQSGISLTFKTLFLLDNHTSHLDIKCIKYAWLNSVALLTFPSYCSHRLQTLDMSVFGPFKHALHREQ